MASEFLAVVGRYSALCFGIYTPNTAPPGGWKPKASPLLMLYKNVKSTKIVTVSKGPVGLGYMLQNKYVLYFSTPDITGSGWALQCTCYGIYTHNTGPARLIIILLM